MSYLQKLKEATSIHDFAPLLGFEPKKLAYILFKEEAQKKYTKFMIPKKSGGLRIINAPQGGLKLAQRRLANILNNCVQEIEKNQSPPRKAIAHGFKEKIKVDSENTISLGIHTNAKCHKNRRYVLNCDIIDFFPSFNFGRVRGFFIHNNDFKLSPEIATLIAQIACHENQLPQGSPCSPIITNLITHILDIRLTRWAKDHGCTYSRYADDLTFSTNQKVLPEHLARLSVETNKWLLNENIEAIITRSGFSINPSKTRLQFRPSRQIVTGLVVNKKVNVRREYYRYARSMCHSLFSTGTFYLPESNENGSLKQLEGILNHICFIKNFGRSFAENEQLRDMIELAKKEKKRAKLDSATELYSRFLYYQYFVSPHKPLIMTEGKTDIIYLKAAINQLAKKDIYTFPHKITFFPFTRRINEVMRIHDGAGALKNFIEHYQESTNFKFQPRLYPVIVLLDNDKEAQEVIHLLSGKFKNNTTHYDRNHNFLYHALLNLYVVLLPKTGSTAQNNKIEDFFDSSVTKRELDGKVFSSENGKEFDKDKHYSKQVLATKIIKPEQDNIDFKKFQPILELISNAIQMHITSTKT